MFSDSPTRAWVVNRCEYCKRQYGFWAPNAVAAQQMRTDTGNCGSYSCQMAGIRAGRERTRLAVLAMRGAG